MLMDKTGVIQLTILLKQWKVNDEKRENLVTWYKFAFAVWLVIVCWSFLKNMGGVKGIVHFTY